MMCGFCHAHLIKLVNVELGFEKCLRILIGSRYRDFLTKNLVDEGFLS